MAEDEIDVIAEFIHDLLHDRMEIAAGAALVITELDDAKFCIGIAHSPFGGDGSEIGHGSGALGSGLGIAGFGDEPDGRGNNDQKCGESAPEGERVARGGRLGSHG